MYIPPFIPVVWQRKKTDCSVACLAMMCAVSYEDALLAIGKKRVLTRGIALGEVIKAALKLGKVLTFHRAIDLDNDTGILGVKGGVGWDYEHLVILHNGSIIDPQDKAIWDHETYLSANGAAVTSLLTLDTGPEGK